MMLDTSRRRPIDARLALRPLLALAFALASLACASAPAHATRPDAQSLVAAGGAFAPEVPLDPRRAAIAHTSSAGPRREARAASPDDARWFEGFALPVVDGRVWAFAEYHGELIVGGFFRQIGGVEVNYVARWNGTAWRSLGGGLDGGVRTLEVIGDSLYVGGTFEVAGSVPAEGIACWNGTSWSAVGSGLHGSVNAIAKHLGGIAVAGDVTLGVTGVNVAQWNGSQWTSLLSGLDGSVNDLTVFGGELVAAGSFRHQNGAPLDHVAIFDGAAWTPAGLGISAAEITPSLVTVLSMTPYEGRLFVTGFFDQAGGQAAFNVAVWTGSAWDTAGTLFGLPHSLHVVAGSLYACGSLWSDSLEPGLVAGIRLWAGGRWVVPTQNAREPVYAMGAYHDTVVVSGASGLPLEDVQILRASGWRPLRGPWRPQDRGFAGRSRPPIVRALLPTGSLQPPARTTTSVEANLFAAGDFVAAGSAGGLIDAPSFAHTARAPLQWYVEPLATDFSGEVNALCNYNGTVVAGGLFSAAPSFPSARVSNIAFWDGTGWQALGGGLNGEVFALAVYHGELYAGGSFTLADGLTSVSGIARWNGVSWRALGSATDGPAVVYSLLSEADTLWIGGAFLRMGGAVATNIAAWDGAGFRELGYGVRTRGLDGFAGAMTRFQNRLVVAGNFTLAGLIETNQIAQWNGLEWEPLGTSTWGGSVLALANVRGTLWAGGQFYEQGGPEIFNLASWDGASWRAPGSEPEGFVYTIASVGDTVYAGGNFTIAGGKSSFGIARWDPPSTVAHPGSVAAVEAAPNPMAGSATLVFTLPVSGDFELSIHDLNGRRVYVTTESAVAGARHVTWNGRGSDGGLVPAGLYFVRVTTHGSERARGRIAVVR